MRPPGKQNPGAGERTGAACNRQLDCFYFNRFSAKFQAFSRFEPELSLVIDKIVLEAGL